MTDEATTQQGVAQPADVEARFEQAATGLMGQDPPSEEDAAPEQAATEQDVAPEQKEDETPTYADLDEFLAAQKVDPESFRNLNVKVKVDGKEEAIPLSDVIKSFQLERHVNNKSIQLSEQQKQLESHHQQAVQQLQQQFAQAQQVAQIAHQQLLHEYNAVDWNALRAQDPGQYAALHTEFQQRQGQIGQAMQAIQQQQDMQAQQQQQQLAATIEQQRQLMLEKNPEWRDQGKFTEARSSMMNYAKQIGFSDAELGQVFDHRLMRVLHDAASYQALQAAKPETLKRIRQAPPMAKAGTRQTTDPQSVQREAVFQRLRQNPNDRTAQEAAFDVFARV